MTTFEHSFYGEKLRIGRLFAGLTLAELGSLVGASRQYIHQLETGATPAEDMVGALADALGVTPTFFQSLPSGLIDTGDCHFRRLRKTKVSAQHQIMAFATLFSDVVARLESTLDLPAVNFPSIDIDGIEDVETAAADARQYWGLTPDQPIKSVTRVLENAGAIVTEFSGAGSDIDALSVARLRPLIVRSDAKTAISRIRFDLAHECGHLVMHQGIVTGDEETEAQANRFAGAFLVPRAAFVREFPRGSRFDWLAIFAMKKRWGISAQAIIHRASDLGLIDQAQTRRAYRFLSGKGYMRCEPGESEHSEVPEMFADAIDAIQVHFGITPAALCRELGVKPEVFNRVTGIAVEEQESSDTPSNVIQIDLFRSRR